MTWAVIALIVALQAADGIQTWNGVRSRRLAEANPIARKLIARFGLGPALVLTKGGAALFFIVAVLAFPQWWWAWLPAIAIMAWAVWSNHRLMRR